MWNICLKNGTDGLKKRLTAYESKLVLIRNEKDIREYAKNLIDRSGESGFAAGN